jgi:hypothetical protein
MRWFTSAASTIVVDRLATPIAGPTTPSLRAWQTVYVKRASDGLSHELAMSEGDDDNDSM